MRGILCNAMRNAALIAVFALWASAAFLAPAAAQTPARETYPWPHTEPVTRTLEQAIPAPGGFQRLPAEKGSFAAWLRALPVKPDGAPVKLFDGRLKGNQQAHAAVIDMDTGSRDLQQCADAVMRLRAEYLLSTGREDSVGFNNTEGKRLGWADWKRKRGGAAGYENFRRYLIQVFAYAGTYSLEREMAPAAVKDMRIGDVFIKGGFPGHAELVADMAENPSTGERRFLLIQSFMPAQDIHVLKNPANRDDPWYSINFGESLITPEWSFPAGALRRFR